MAERHHERTRSSVHESGRRATESSSLAGLVDTGTLQRGADEFQDLMLSGLAMARQMTEHSVDQTAKLFGYSGANTQRATEEASHNVEAVISSGAVMARAMQEMSREWFNFSRQRLEHVLQHAESLARCRTPQDFVAAQSELWRDNVEGVVESSRRLAELSERMAEESGRRITGRIAEPRKRTG